MTNSLKEFGSREWETGLQPKLHLPLKRENATDQFEGSQQIELRSNFDLPVLKNFPDVQLMVLGIEHGSVTSEEVTQFIQINHEGLEPQVLAALPALRQFQEARKAFNQAYIDCTLEPGKPRSLLPPDWKKVSVLLAESQKLAALTGPFQELSEKLLKTDANIADVKQLIDEHYEIARQEVKYLKAQSTSWWPGSEKKSVDSEQLAALQHAILETIESLSEYPDLQTKYIALLGKSEPRVDTQKTPKELEDLYQPELSKRHPTQTPETFFERHRDTLGIVAHASMLGSTFLHPEPAGDSRERSIVARINALKEQQLRERGSTKPAPESPSAPQTRDLSRLAPTEQTAALALVRNVMSTEPLSKTGVNTAYKLTASDGSAYMLKKFTKEDEQHFLSREDAALMENFSAKHESAASTLASFVTGGLVSEGRPYGDCIAYPFESIVSISTKKVFTHTYPNYGYENVYPRLSPVQRVDLFVNMVADMVLLNPDTHSGQFAINTDGHLIAFDKGRAYFDAVFRAEKLDTISMPSDFLKKSKIYRDFIEELNKHPEELKAILTDDRVKQAFSNIDSLSLDSQQPYVKQLLSPLFTFIDHKTSGDKAKMQALSGSYFEMLKGVPNFLAQELGVERSSLVSGSSVHEVTTQTIDSNARVAAFDPKKHHMVSVSAKELGYPRGLRVSEIVQKSGGIAGMNAGFFSEATSAQTGLGWFAAKIRQKTGMQTEAFPIAILKSSGRLLSDTSDYLPTLGWSEDGIQIEIGEVKVAWQAKLFAISEPIPLVRRTDINLDVLEAIIYFKSGHQAKAVTLKYGKVVSVADVPEADPDKPNGYWLKEPSVTTVQAFERLKPGDELSFESKLEAKDPTQNSRFSQFPHVVSGGRILMTNGELDPRSKDSHGRSEQLSSIGTVVGIDPKGKVSLVVRPGDESIEEMVEKLKKMGIERAISFDGGGSPTLISPGYPEPYGSNRVVSDAIVVMPKEQPKLSDKLAQQEGDLFDALIQGDVNRLEELLDSEPARIHSLNRNRQGLLQSYVLYQSERKQPLDEKMVNLLIKKMTSKDFESQDQFGETLVHTLLRNNQRELAVKIINDLGEDSEIWKLQGRSKQVIFDVDISLNVPEKVILSRAFEILKSGNDQARQVILEEVNAWLEQGKYVDEIIKFAKDAYQSSDSGRVKVASQLFGQLLKNGQGFEEAIVTAQAGIVSSDDTVQRYALNLFQKLFEKGQGFEEAIVAAQAGIGSSNNSVRRSALDLFIKLFEKDQGYTEAVVVAQGGIVSSDDTARRNALNLFQKLFEKGQGFEEAIAVSQAGIINSDNSVRESAWKLFSNLVDKDRGTEEAVAAAQTASLSSDKSVQRSALDLFRQLVDKNRGMEEAVTAAQTASLSSDKSVQRSALDLFRQLVDKNRGIEEAVTAAQAASLSSDNSVQRSALALFRQLVDKDRGTEEAVAAAQAASLSSDKSVQEFALNLFYRLLKKNKGIEKAIAAAQAWSLSSDWSVWYNGFDLFGDLFEKGQGFEEAIAVAQAGIVSSDSTVGRNALNLFQELFVKGKGFEEALISIQTGMESSNKDNKVYAFLLNKLINNLDMESSENKKTRIVQINNALIKLSESTDEEVRTQVLRILTALIKSENIENSAVLSFIQLFLKILGSIALLKIKDNPENSVSVFSVLSLLVVMMKRRSDSRQLKDAMVEALSTHPEVQEKATEILKKYAVQFPAKIKKLVEQLKLEQDPQKQNLGAELSQLLVSVETMA